MLPSTSLLLASAAYLPLGPVLQPQFSPAAPARRASPIVCAENQPTAPDAADKDRQLHERLLRISTAKEAPAVQAAADLCAISWQHLHSPGA